MCDVFRCFKKLLATNSAVLVAIGAATVFLLRKNKKTVQKNMVRKKLPEAIAEYGRIILNRNIVISL